MGRIKRTTEQRTTEDLRRRIAAETVTPEKIARESAGTSHRVYMDPNGRTLVTIYDSGTVTVAQRPHPDAVWGPSIRCLECEA